MRQHLRAFGASLVLVALAGACSSGSSSKQSTSKRPSTTARATTTTASTTTVPAAPVDQTKPEGTNGLAVDGRNLWVADWRGSQVLRVDRATGRILARFGKAQGVTTSDDVVVGPDHAIYWSGLGSGNVGRIGPDGTVSVVAHLDPSVNPITFAKDGTLYTGRTEIGTGLYAIDTSGKTPPKQVSPTWDTNAFAFGPDGYLYGPKKGMSGAGAVDKIDVKTGAITEVKTGFNYPVAVKFDRRGALLVLSTQGATLQKLDVETGAVTDVAKPATPIVDNFAIAPDGTIYISSFTQNVITVVKPDGSTSTINVGQ
ncbi:MAG: hypothetical protein U0V73_04115 [Acidimicrobiia bacterium]